MEILSFKGTDLEKLKKAMDVRIEVFMEEQGISAEDEFDDRDPTSTYVLIEKDGKPLACGRVNYFSKTAYLGRIAVLKEQRKEGLGRIVIEKLIEISKENGAEEITLGAQLQAVGFYEKLGFEPYGDIYLDASIEHINMKLL